MRSFPSEGSFGRLGGGDDGFDSLDVRIRLGVSRLLFVLIVDGTIDARFEGEAVVAEMFGGIFVELGAERFFHDRELFGGELQRDLGRVVAVAVAEVLVYAVLRPRRLLVDDDLAGRAL